MLENPGWYTAYTPYQAEIAQGRLEALLNFQTMVVDLTGLEIANASLLDEATGGGRGDDAVPPRGAQRKPESVLRRRRCLPQTIEVVRTRAKPLGLEVVMRHRDLDAAGRVPSRSCSSIPAPTASVRDYRRSRTVHAGGGARRRRHRPPGADAAHAARRMGRRRRRRLARSGSACRWATAARTPPSSRRATSTSARCRAASSASRSTPTAVPRYRLALQTREQHIRREKATSNICTAQVLLAVIAGMYAVYHGPAGLTTIARRVHRLTAILAAGLERLGHTVPTAHFFDTIVVATGEATAADRRSRRRAAA